MAAELGAGRQVPAYGYALNNPTGIVDPDGLRVRITADRNSWFSTMQDATWVLRSDPGVDAFFNRCFGQNPFTNNMDHLVHGSDNSLVCGATGWGAWTSGLSTTICSGRFTNPPAGPPGTGALHIAKSIMHELAHQLAPFKTNDTPAALGCEPPQDKCSAQEAEQVAIRAFSRRSP